MKKFLTAILTAACISSFVFAAGCNQAVSEPYEISVSWSKGVEGVIFTQNGERLLPKNGKIRTAESENIEIEVSLMPGYRQNAPTLKVDGETTDIFAAPATADSIEITALPNSDISLCLGEGVGYRIDELKRVDEEVGYTSLIGVYLEEGYRKISAPKVSVIVTGAEYTALSSLAPYGLDGAELKNAGYHSFYSLRVLENTAVGVMGVVADTASPDEYATVTHNGGEGYTLRALIDTNNDGISDLQQILSGETKVVKGTVLNIMIFRDSAYSAANAKLYANGTEITGTQGEGADFFDPLSNELIYCVKAEGDITLTVDGIKKIGQFTLHIMNKDGSRRYKTFCRADSLAQALAQIPGNDDRENEAYLNWWEPNPGAGYTFRYWRFDGHVYTEIDQSYTPALYEDIYCGYVADGVTPDDPMDRPTIPVENEKPTIPDSAVLPQSLKQALNAVADLSGDRLTESQWVLAWAAYKLYKAGAADLGRPSIFKNANIYDDYMEDLLSDYKTPAANNLWAYAYDMLKDGSSEIDLESLKSCFINPKGGAKRNWANNEALVREIVNEYIPEFGLKTSYTIGNTDDLNMTIMLILDSMNVEWSLSGTPVSRYTKETYREYVAEHAKEGTTANVVKEVLDYIDSLGD